jgi:hypothetical protein
MKALSIIGIILSIVGILNSLVVMDIKSYFDTFTSDTGLAPGIISLVISAFFLSFSITATVVSFRKKTI